MWAYDVDMIHCLMMEIEKGGGDVVNELTWDNHSPHSQCVTSWLNVGLRFLKIVLRDKLTHRTITMRTETPNEYLYNFPVNHRPIAPLPSRIRIALKYGAVAIRCHSLHWRQEGSASFLF